jgi:tetratricopeptide (TPR) repeat protein
MPMNRLLLAATAAAALLTACATTPRPGSDAEPPEAVSLLGAPLYAPPLAPEARARMEAQLAEARAAHAREPASADAAIWLGRRLAYLGRYREAIDAFTAGIARNPDDPRLYRHRGHRYVTVRELDAAIRDFERAVRLMEGMLPQVEPDGMPNPAGIPRTTLQFNVWYHLGLAHYLRGDFEQALPAFHRSLAVSDNDDARVAATDWTYMTLRRLGRDDEAARLLEPIHAGMEILENDAYLRRLRMYRGEIQPETLLAADGDAVTLATQGYGVANWHLYNGRTAEAHAIFRRIVRAENWAPFGYIAAEAELARTGGR